MRNYGRISEERLAEILFMAFHGKIRNNSYEYGWVPNDEGRVMREFRRYAKMVVDEWDMSEMGTIYKGMPPDDPDYSVASSGNAVSFQIIPSCGDGCSYRVSFEECK